MVYLIQLSLAKPYWQMLYTQGPVTFSWLDEQCANQLIFGFLSADSQNAKAQNNQASGKAKHCIKQDSNDTF